VLEAGDEVADASLEKLRLLIGNVDRLLQTGIVLQEAIALVFIVQEESE